MQKIQRIEIGKDYAIQGVKVTAVVIRTLRSTMNYVRQITFSDGENRYIANQWNDGSIYRITKQLLLAHTTTSTRQ